jgi:hypothetical protein
MYYGWQYFWHDDIDQNDIGFNIHKFWDSRQLIMNYPLINIVY